MAGSRCFLSLFCPDIDDDRLSKLIAWCDRYSPLVSRDGADGVILDITGCAHLFGGEDELLFDLQRRLQRMRIDAHAAVADSWGAAWALARYGGHQFIVHGVDKTIAAIDSLPVEALRLPENTVWELRRLGIVTVAALRRMPANSLTTRFGPVVVERLQQALLQVEEPLTPWRPPAVYRASRVLAEPVSTAGSVEYVLQDLLREVCGKLELNHLGSRHMDLACFRVDGTVDRCEARTSKPNRSVPHMMRLFAGNLEKLWANFGFETFVLSVCDTEPLYPLQACLSSNELEQGESFDLLVDRVGMKLGFGEVNRIVVCESYLPEYATTFCPAASATIPASAEWPEYRVRPVRLIDPPMPIQVSVSIPGGDPVQFLIGRQNHRVVRCEGPERLGAEWWRDNENASKTRDYYRIEDEQGMRFWVYLDAVKTSWYLHGHFA